MRFDPATKRKGTQKSPHKACRCRLKHMGRSIKVASTSLDSTYILIVKSALQVKWE